MEFLTNQNTWKASNILFLFMLVLCGVFAMERVCYVDSAYMLFRMINAESLVAEGGRWMNIPPQLIPWIMIKLKLPLQFIIFFFSLMQGITLYGFFLLTGYYFKQKFLGIIFLLLLIISVNETFFDVVTETKFSLALGVLFTAFLNSKKRSELLLGTGIIFCGFFSHPSFVIYFIFILLFHGIFKPHETNWKWLIPGLVFFLLKHFLIGSTTYESNMFNEAINHLLNDFQNSFIHHYFSGLFKTQFIFIFTLFVIIILHLISERKWKLLIAYFFTLFITYFLLAILYHNGDSRMMIQKTMHLFHFIILIPLFYIWNDISAVLQKIAILLILSACIFAFSGIIQAREKYRSRMLILTEFMQQLPTESDKFILREEHIDHDRMMATWALPHETLLISNVKFGKSIVVKNFRERNDTLLYYQFPNAFRPAFGYPMMNRELNPSYFSIDESRPLIWLDSAHLPK